MKNEAKREIAQAVRDQARKEIRLECMVFGSVRNEEARACLSFPF